MSETAEIPKVQKITVNGRSFVPVADTTIEQDQLIASILESSGLIQLRKFNPLTDDLSEASRQLVMRAFATGKLFTLLGAMLAEREDEEFSLEAAAERANFLRKLKRTVDKDALRGAIVALIMSFFVSGAWFEKRFQKYSLSAATNQMNQSKSPEGRIGEVLDTITESGMTS